MSVDANCVVNIVLLSAPDCEDVQVFSFQQPSVGIGHQGDKGERIVMVVRTNLAPGARAYSGAAMVRARSDAVRAYLTSQLPPPPPQ